MDQNEWENARVSMDFKLLAHHYMDLDHPNFHQHLKVERVFSPLLLGWSNVPKV